MAQAIHAAVSSDLDTRVGTAELQARWCELPVATSQVVWRWRAEAPPLLAALLLAMVTIPWFAERATWGITGPSFGDESGHLVGARAIHAGDRLYRDFIDAHGPVSFIAAQLAGHIFGWKVPVLARWMTVALMAMASVAIATSHTFRNNVARILAVALFLGLLAAPWNIQALNMLSYHPIGGALSVMALAWLVVPAWVGARVPRWQAAAAGLCLALLCGTAYSLAPSAMLFMAAGGLGIWRGKHTDPIRPVLLLLAGGFAAGCVILLVWLLTFGDLVGYVIFHFIQLQTNYARYTPFGWHAMLDSLVPSAAPIGLVQTTAVFAGAAGFSLLILMPWRGRPRALAIRTAEIACTLAGVLMLNFRGSILFQDGGFVVACMGLLALALPAAAAGGDVAPGLRRSLLLSVASLGICAAVETACRSALASPFGYTRDDLVNQPKTKLKLDRTQPIFARIQKILRPGERLLVLVYNPTFFLQAGYLPIRKFHEYLPWEQDYAKAPWFGRERDLCATLRRDPPPVIVYDGWKVWGAYDAVSFMPCVPSLLSSQYVADPIPTLFIRKDRLPAGKPASP